MKVAQFRGRMGDSEVESWLGESDDILQQALTYTRSLVAHLTPMALHEFGLAAALKWLADQMRQQYRLSVQVDVQHGMSVTLPEDQSVLIFFSHNMVELQQMASGIGLGAWSAIAKFHELSSARASLADPDVPQDESNAHH